MLFIVNPDFNVILNNETTVGANHKFFTSAPNSLKEIAANKGNLAK